MVNAAKIAYRDFPTVVNEVPESGMTYRNTKRDYARMDSKMQSAQKAIGGSSDVAQLSQSYYWDNISKRINDETTQQYYENTVILAVCAQLAIDGCKKVFAVDVNDDISRIRSQPCMKRAKDYPEFMRWTREVRVTKNGNERPQEDINLEKNKLRRRIDSSIVCPMSQLEKCLDKIQGMPKEDSVDTKEFFIKKPGKKNQRHTSKINNLIHKYDGYVKYMMILMNEDSSEDIIELIILKTNEVIDNIKNMNLSEYTMNNLIGSVLGVDWGVKEKFKYNVTSKYTRKVLMLLYRSNKSRFLSNFITKTYQEIF